MLNGKSDCTEHETRQCMKSYQFRLIDCQIGIVQHEIPVPLENRYYFVLIRLVGSHL